MNDSIVLLATHSFTVMHELHLGM